MKKNSVTILIIGATVILAGVALFTAVRLYQLRQESVTPGEPESEPAATEVQATLPPSQCNLTFTLVTQTGTPKGSATPTATATATATARASATPTSTPTGTPPIGGLPSPTPTATPTPTSTATTTPVGTLQPTATPASLPSAGVGTPTVIGIAMGLLLLVGALVLAL